MYRKTYRKKTIGSVLCFYSKSTKRCKFKSIAKSNLVCWPQRAQPEEVSPTPTDLSTLDGHGMPGPCLAYPNPPLYKSAWYTVNISTREKQPAVTEGNTAELQFLRFCRLLDHFWFFLQLLLTHSSRKINSFKSNIGEKQSVCMSPFITWQPILVWICLWISVVRM